MARFNERFAYKDGLKLRIVKVKSDTLSRTGCCTKPGSPIAIVTLKLDNRTRDVFDPRLFSATLTYGKAATTAEQVFDTEEEIGRGFARKVMPGRVAIFDYAYSVPSSGMGNVVLRVDVEAERHEVLFKGAIT